MDLISAWRRAVSSRSRTLQLADLIQSQITSGQAAARVEAALTSAICQRAAFSAGRNCAPCEAVAAAALRAPGMLVGR